MVFGILLIVLFNQQPELFVLALALLTGGCTVLANVLTNFRSYCAVLTAFTAAIIAAFAVDDPNSVFNIAMARGSCILTGLACAIVITTVFAPHHAEAQTRKSLLLALQDAARRAAVLWQEPHDHRLAIGRKLINELIALDTQIEYAAAESGTFRVLSNEARSLVVHLFSVVSAGARSMPILSSMAGRSTTRCRFSTVSPSTFCTRCRSGWSAGEVAGLIAELDDIERQLLALRPEEEAMPEQEIVSARLVIDRMDDLVRHLKGALEEYRNFLEGRPVDRPPVTLNFHKDIRAAWINGMRAFVAVCVTGVFWIASAWPTGSLALVFVVVCLSLFSYQPHPDRVGWSFMKGGLLGVATALAYKFFVINGPNDFTYLLLTSGVILFPLGVYFIRPGYLPAAGSFSFVFLSLVQFENQISFDLADTLNRSMAILVGYLIGTLAFILILPANPAAARRYVTYRIRRGLDWLAVTRLRPGEVFAWETRMYDRVMRLNDPENPSSTPDRPVARRRPGGAHARQPDHPAARLAGEQIAVVRPAAADGEGRRRLRPISAPARRGPPGRAGADRRAGRPRPRSRPARRAALLGARNGFALGNRILPGQQPCAQHGGGNDLVGPPLPHES